MAKSKAKVPPYKVLPYFEPPPDADSSSPGRGIWSVAPDISVIDDEREALRQAIFDTIKRVAPEIVEAPGERTIPPELSFDWWYSVQFSTPHQSPPHLMTHWWQLKQRIGEVFRGVGRGHLAKVPAPTRRLSVGTAELHVEKSWRFCPGHQSRKDVRQGILADFIRDLDSELDVRYDEIKRWRPGPSSRRNLERDATRLVLLRFLGLSIKQISDYEAGYEVPLDDGRVLKRPDLDTEEEEQGLPDRKAEEQKRAAIDQSIRNLERAAELTFPSRPRGPQKGASLDDTISRDFLA